MTFEYNHAVGGPGYAMIGTTLRAPRVAVVFDAADAWEFRALQAIRAIGGVWGGDGFILIPHTRGVVDPTLLRMAAAYDPDYVVSFLPDDPAIDIDDSGAIVTSHRERAEDDPSGYPDPTTAVSTDTGNETARQRVVGVCDPYRANSRREQPTMLSIDFVDPPLIALSSIIVPQSGRDIGIPADLTGSPAVAAAMRCGVTATATTVPAQDPAHRGMARALITYSLQIGPSYTPQSIVGMVTGFGAQAPITRLAATRTGLEWIEPTGPPTTQVLVVGGRAEDFAFAYAWRVMCGAATWFPWHITAPDTVYCDEVLMALRNRMSHFGRWRGSLVVTAVDPDVVGDPACADLLERVGYPLRGNLPGDRRRLRVHVRTAAAQDVTVRAGRYLAVSGRVELHAPQPVHTTAAGTVTMAIAPAAHPTPTEIAEDRLQWEVDVSFPGVGMPHGRGFPPECLLADGESALHTVVRRSGGTVSYQSHRSDGPHRAASRLARPRLRHAGLADWVSDMASAQGVVAALSSAGVRSDQLETLLGGRKELVTVFTATLLPVLRAFHVDAKKSSDAYPRGHGVVLGGAQRKEGYLSFGGMAAAVGKDISPSHLRVLVDGLLARRVLSRGLVLRCAQCRTLTFLRVDDLGQFNRCRRCDAVTSLGVDAWKEPVTEPAWFYDLHPAARELLAEHGEVPLLASAHLRATASWCVDVAEVQFTELQRSRPFAEIDLIAHTDHGLIVAEAKSTDTTGKTHDDREQAAAKLVRAATLLDADWIMLATTKPRWQPASVAAVTRAVTDASVRRPLAVRVISGLGTRTVVDDMSS